jgi:hypothetical protein
MFERDSRRALHRPIERIAGVCIVVPGDHRVYGSGSPRDGGLCRRGLGEAEVCLYLPSRACNLAVLTYRIQ